MEKTNALRALDKAKVAYRLHTYETDGRALDAQSVAKAISQSPDKVFKTLVARGSSKKIYVLVINGQDELDLKKAALSLHEKSIELVEVKELLALTGYVRGGCSPVGMKKVYTTCFDAKAAAIPDIIVSAGKIGMQMEVDAKALIGFVHGEMLDLVSVS